MQFKRNISIATAMFFASLIWSSTGSAQPTPTPIAMPSGSAVEDVAIIIVDVFEEGITSPVDASTLLGDCVVSILGQDGLSSRGNVSSALFPLTHPHGNLVLKHMQNVLETEYGGSVVDSIPGTNAPNSELWSTQFGNIWLVGVDTQGYMFDVITNEVNAAINSLNINQNIKRFVINMSFGIVPCEIIPSLTVQDYLDQLERWGVDLTSGTPLGNLGVALTNILGSPDELDALLNLRNDPNNTVIINAFSYLHLTVMQNKIKVALTPATNPNVFGGDQPTFNPFESSDPSVTIVQVASAGNDGYDFPYYPAHAQNVLSVSASYSPHSCAPAAHNQIYKYLNGDLGFPGIAVDQIIHNVLSPMSNYGSVMENGVSTLEPDYYLRDFVPGAQVLGCLNGTSFAAPRVSIHMAFDQMSGNGIACFDPNTGDKLSEPPLAHTKWDNLDIQTAAATYCPDFPR